MPRDPAIDDILKGAGRDITSAPAAKTAAPPATAPAGERPKSNLDPSFDRNGPLQSDKNLLQLGKEAIFPPEKTGPKSNLAPDFDRNRPPELQTRADEGKAFATPIAKGAWRNISDTAALPTLPFGAAGAQARNAVSNLPYIKDMNEWAADDSKEGFWGTVGRGAGYILPFGVAGAVRRALGLGFESGLTSLATKQGAKQVAKVPPAVAMGGKFGNRMMANPAKAAAQASAQRMTNLAGKTGRVLDKTVPGAVAGAATDRDHPIEGAVGGAIGGMIPGGIAKAGTGGAVGIAASHLIPHAAALALAPEVAAHVGAMGWFAYPVVWGLARGGQRLAGHWIGNANGKVVGFVPAGAKKILRAGTAEFLAATGAVGGGLAAKEMRGNEEVATPTGGQSP
jgi:hypothetical protein